MSSMLKRLFSVGWQCNFVGCPGKQKALAYQPLTQPVRRTYLCRLNEVCEFIAGLEAAT